MTFQAPPGPGLYTFQAHIMNDSFVGTDTQKDVRVCLLSFCSLGLRLTMINR